MKILITDDSNSWLEYHTNNLKKLFLPDTYISVAKSARQGLDLITLNIDEPFDIILTDMNMESDFLPLFAGEWFIKQIKTFKEYNNSKIVAVSAAVNIKQIADKYGVLYIPKYNCGDIEAYKKVLLNN